LKFAVCGTVTVRLRLAVGQRQPSYEKGTAYKGIRSVPTAYRPSKRAEDQEAGAIGAPGQWPVRLEGGGSAAGNISALISAENADICNNADISIS
jgi:hypothetical protein